MPPSVSYLNIEPEHLTATLTTRGSIEGSLSSKAKSLEGTLVSRSVIYEYDYNELNNKPSINSVILEGNLTAHDLGLGVIYYDTKENWDSQVSIVSERAAVYIYSNYKIIFDEVGNPIYIAGIKIGDGQTYLIDLPFITDDMTAMLLQHIGNEVVHLTAAEREFWNNKISCYLALDDTENLVFSKTNYIVEDI